MRETSSNLELPGTGAGFTYSPSVDNGKTLLLLASGQTGCPEPAWGGCAAQAGEAGGCPMLLSAICSLPSRLGDLGPCGSPGTSGSSDALPQSRLSALRRRSGYAAAYAAPGSVASRTGQLVTDRVRTMWLCPLLGRRSLCSFPPGGTDSSKTPVLKTAPWKLTS